MPYLYPPKIVAGTLKKATGADYIQGKILQILDIVRGELVYNQAAGVPFRLFTSITDISADAARLEIVLEQEVQEADFNVSAQIITEGSFIMLVRWAYLGDENIESFQINL